MIAPGDDELNDESLDRLAVEAEAGYEVENLRPRERPRRINVAVNPETLDALQGLSAREGATLTEAVRRLIGYGDVVYRAVREDGDTILLMASDGTTREVRLI